MKIIYKIIFLTIFSILLIFAFSRWKGSDNKEDIRIDTIFHYNLIIAPDISNRIRHDLYPKAVSDQDIIKSIAENIQIYLKIGRQTYQKDVYRVDLINKKQISLYGIDANNLEINFYNFADSQLNRIDFITGVNKKDNLSKRQNSLLKEVNHIYSKGLQQNVGSDVWTYMNTGFNENLLGKELKSIDIPEKNKRFINAYRNLLIILTDGYIETINNGQCNGNQCNELTQLMVNKFRNAYLQKGQGESIKTFFDKNGYGITPVENPALKETEVLVLEMYDRSLTNSGIATVHPTDYEILKLFWEDWLNKSSVKNAKIYPAASSIPDVTKSVNNFIGLP